MKLKKRIFPLLLTAAMVLLLVPGGAFKARAVETHDISSGGVSITTAGDYVITGDGSAKTNTITVTGNIVVNITLSNVNISTSGCAFSIGSGATVNLTLTGINTLTSGGNYAGLQVPSGATLTITAASTGSLTATANSYGAGIGGGIDDSHGNITIDGGTISATASNAAAIGGGFAGFINSGIITINGGTVTAKSTGMGAAIGGGGASIAGTSGSGGFIKITGGTIIATAIEGAAIGGGACGGSVGGSGGYISISGGNITAKAVFADIGGGSSGGYGGSGGTVTITGGNVTTDNKNIGMSDIGGGCNSSMGDGNCSGDNSTIFISGGSVNSYVHNAPVVQSSMNPVNVYKAAIKSLPVSSSVTCSINGGTAFSCGTDSSGYLSLWLPVGANTVLVSCGTATYKAEGAITAVNTNELTASAYTPALSITTASLPYGLTGTAYSQTLTAVGGTAPYTWSASGLPAGLTLKTDTGVISGTPTVTGNYTASVTVTDSGNNSVSKDLTLNVYSTNNPSVPYITIVNGTAFTVTVYDADGKYIGTNSASGGGITGTVTGKVSDSNSSDTVLTGTLTGVPTTLTEITLGGDKLRIKAVTAPTTTVSNPSFY